MKKKRKLSLGKMKIAAINYQHTIKGGTDGDTVVCFTDSIVDATCVTCPTHTSTNTEDTSTNSANTIGASDNCYATVYCNP